MLALHHKWFPGREATVQTMGEALHLETDYWDKMRTAITNGIARAFKG
ncbi:MAG: hypothetical protein KUA35_09050 [Pseudodesulfovibrio sp.]|uniref:Uncharacterized protein n=1 Tax=Pseudodesulfovibrio aespoeensis (strain ATCC 700646 / DSM 10631 / Aspo-2) TaxID=643562 RepID=E6VXM4_PSEA9|nr:MULTISPECIES: hypothetical protein [Pseudodesulfovibrio]MBU4192887.1 hypothetical protein [Pseudomonadota bacterium]ADU61482.1 hypothetical protein Daes_0461 [Pseudodesulfovibrio aespoeensis Aspo-2]MBU4244516.1 hypothetical protein [Pseudomonadota bacterium]MBU4379850.1 hypothetical protein [Pseudomonadota bacterium]MBU4476526.1 hypothetical protein [Pseudomonadota bacterium]